MLASPACMRAELLLSCLTLLSTADRSLPDFSVRGILQASILHGLPCPPPGDISDPGIKPTSLMSPALVGGFFTTGTSWETLVSLGYCINDGV